MYSNAPEEEGLIKDTIENRTQADGECLEHERVKGTQAFSEWKETRGRNGLP